MRDLKLSARVAAGAWSFLKMKKNENAVIAAGW